MIRVTVLLMLAASIALANDVAGKWKASTPTPTGQSIEQVFDLKVDGGGKLTGTVSSPRGSTEITDGKVEGDSVSFAVVRNMGGNDVKMQYRGKVEGDDLKLSVAGGDREREIIAKRVKE